MMVSVKQVKKADYRDYKERYLDHFFSSFSPIGEANKPKHGIYGGVPFIVTETRSTYSITMDGVTKRFTNALDAANWVQSNKPYI